jgi:hypothetical protein
VVFASQLKGVVPPAAVIWMLYGTPIAALGSVAGVAIDSAEEISSVRVVEAVCGVLLESVTEIVTKYWLGTFVVPLIKPVEESKLKLRGCPVMVHVNG